MSLTNFYQELKRRNPILTYAGLLNFVVLFIALILSFVDTRTVLGINAWIKPMKFLFSVGVYIWTVGWILEHLRISKVTHRLLSITLAVIMFIENSMIVTQAIRGVPSHYNFTTATDALIFATMGILIIANTCIVLYLLILFFFRPKPLSAAYLWGIRLGIILLLLASYEGTFMINQEAHSVGVADGGPGLPLINWSTEGGDLRIAHFLGLHAFQILPIFAFFLESRQTKQALWWVFALAFLYASLAIWTFGQAMAGIPLLG